MGQEALDAETVRKFAEATERTIQLQERLGMSPVTGVSNATIAVNAGGVGVWIATTCCLVMLATNIFLAAIVLDHARKIDDLGDYLNAIYMMAPQLKPSKKEE